MVFVPIPQKVRKERLNWYGHVLRQNNNFIAMPALNISPDGKRLRGCPKKRWLDNIRKDVRSVGVSPEDIQNRKI